MAYLKIPRGWEIPEREATPEDVFLNRRKFLAAMGIGAIGATGVIPRRLGAADALYPAKRNPAYKLDRPITDERAATRINNFYEFTEQKEGVWKLVDRFNPEPWTIKVTDCSRTRSMSSRWPLAETVNSSERTDRRPGACADTCRWISARTPRSS